MVDPTKISLTKSMYMIIAMLGSYGAYKVIGLFMLLLVGATGNVAISGNVAVPDIINNTTGDFIVDVHTGYAQFNTGVALILGLITLVVIIAIFWPIISPYLPKMGGKGKGKMI